jgi:hypothetical protein
MARTAYSDLLDRLEKRRHPPKQRTMLFQNMLVTIENPAGSIRSGKDKDGNPWSVRMTFPYGFIRRTKAIDGDGVDVFIGPDKQAKNVYVVHQNQPSTGEFDEDKCMLGFSDSDSAKSAYLSNYNTPDFYRSMTIIPLDRFRQMIATNIGYGHASGDMKDGVKWKKKPRVAGDPSRGAMFSADSENFSYLGLAEEMAGDGHKFDPKAHPRAAAGKHGDYKGGEFAPKPVADEASQDQSKPGKQPGAAGASAGVPHGFGPDASPRPAPATPPNPNRADVVHEVNTARRLEGMAPIPMPAIANPHRMTVSEFSKAHKERQMAAGQPPDATQAAGEHHQFVEDAIHHGLDVPPHVLHDYPHLQPEIVSPDDDTLIEPAKEGVYAPPAKIRPASAPQKPAQSPSQSPQTPVDALKAKMLALRHPDTKARVEELRKSGVPINQAVVKARQEAIEAAKHPRAEMGTAAQFAKKYLSPQTAGSEAPKSPPEDKSQPAKPPIAKPHPTGKESDKLEPHVRERMQKLIERAHTINADIRKARETDPTGQLEHETRQKHGLNDEGLDHLAKFREGASQRGIDAERVLHEMGAPPIEPESHEARTHREKVASAPKPPPREAIIDLRNTGSTSWGDVDVRIIKHPNGGGYAVQTKVKGQHREISEPPMSGKDAMALAAARLHDPEAKYGGKGIEQTAPQASSTAMPLTRNYRAGQNNASVKFASEKQRDLFDLHANSKPEMSNNPRQRAATLDQIKERLKPHFDDESAMNRAAYEAHQHVRESMKGVQDGEQRQITETPGHGTKQAAPVEPQAEKNPDDLKEIGQVGSGISDAMHDHLYRLAQKGETKELGRPSPVLQLAAAVKKNGGIKDREAFKRLATDFGKIKSTGTDWQDEMQSLVKKHSPATDNLVQVIPPATKVAGEPITRPESATEADDVARAAVRHAEDNRPESLPGLTAADRSQIGNAAIEEHSKRSATGGENKPRVLSPEESARWKTLHQQHHDHEYVHVPKAKGAAEESNRNLAELNRARDQQLSEAADAKLSGNADLEGFHNDAIAAMQPMISAAEQEHAQNTATLSRANESLNRIKAEKESLRPGFKYNDVGLNPITYTPMGPAAKAQHAKQLAKDVAAREKAQSDAANADKKKSWSKASIEKKLIEAGDAAGVGQQHVEDDKSLSAFHSPYTFLRSPKTKSGYPGEIERFLEDPENIKYRKILQLTDDPAKAQGADAMGELGEQKYMDLLTRRGSGNVATALENAEKSNDPELQFLAGLHRAASTREKKVPQDTVKTESLQPGHAFEIHGVPVEVQEDEDGEKFLVDHGDIPKTPLTAIEHVPMDKGTLKDVTPDPGKMDFDDPFALPEEQQTESPESEAVPPKQSATVAPPIESEPDRSHLNALELRLSNERGRLAAAKTEHEKKARGVWVAQAEKEIAAEKKFLGISDKPQSEQSDEELLGDLEPSPGTAEPATVARVPEASEAGRTPPPADKPTATGKHEHVGEYATPDEAKAAASIHAAAKQNKPVENTSADDDGEWSTINGTAVLIKDGMVASGPPRMQGKSIKELSTPQNKLNEKILGGKRAFAGGHSDIPESAAKAVNRMSDKAAGEANANIAEVHLHSSASALKKATGRDKAAGSYESGLIHDSVLHLTPSTTDGSLSAEELASHELFHAVDGPTNQYTRDREWKAAFDQEFKGTTDSTMQRAKTNPQEAFAEMGRLTHSPPGGRSRLMLLQHQYPKATAFFKKHDLWPKGKTSANSKPSDEDIQQILLDTHRRLVKDGATLEKESDSGSRYYTMPDGQKIRVSDHAPNAATQAR